MLNWLNTIASKACTTKNLMASKPWPAFPFFYLLHLQSLRITYLRWHLSFPIIQGKPLFMPAFV